MLPTDKELEEFADRIETGVKFCCRGTLLGQGPNKYLFHVLDVFDGYNVAVKFYGKHKQWWHYIFADLSTLLMEYKNDELKFVE
jgi:hypothetical protein